MVTGGQVSAHHRNPVTSRSQQSQVASAPHGCGPVPSLRRFAALLTGLVAATGKRTVTGMLTAAGLSPPGTANPSTLVTSQ
jgi:hypothetical protein